MSGVGTILVGTLRTGVVHKMLSHKQIGFIKAEGLARDVFFHVKDLVGFPTVKSIPPGSPVSFKLREHPKGLRASEVKSI